MFTDQRKRPLFQAQRGAFFNPHLGPLGGPAGVKRIAKDPVVRAIAQDERSQLRNRELATDRIVEQLREATKIRRPRRATKPSKAAKERRVDEKKRRGQTKQLRRPPDE